MMGFDDMLYNGQSKSRSPASRRALERLKEIGARLPRQSRPRVHEVDLDCSVPAFGTERYGLESMLVARKCVDRVADEIREHAE